MEELAENKSRELYLMKNFLSSKIIEDKRAGGDLKAINQVRMEGIKFYYQFVYQNKCFLLSHRNCRP